MERSDHAELLQAPAGPIRLGLRLDLLKAGCLRLTSQMFLCNLMAVFVLLDLTREGWGGGR